MKDKILEAVQISKTYGEGESAVHALRNSDLTLENGTFASIIGSSGSGKSTLLKILGGLLPPTTGKVLLDGQDIYAMNAEQLAQVRRQKIGFIFQDFRLFPEYTVRDNILIPFYLDHRAPDEQMLHADWCGLIQVDLDLNLWTPFWWFNTGATNKTMLLTEEYESAEFLDRWVQAVRKGIPMVVPDAEATKETYPAEYDLYQRLGIRSVIAVFLEPRPVALLAVRNPKRYIQQTSMLRILAYVLLASYNEQKMLNRLQMAYARTPDHTAGGV